MKLLALFTTFVVVLSSTLFAAPVGNSALPHIIERGFFIPPHYWIDVRVGYEGDFVSDGRLDQKKEGSGRVDGYSQTTNSGTLTLNLVDRLDLYGVFGSSRSSAEWRFTEGGEVIHHVELETLHECLWAVGGRAILFEWGSCDLGVGGRYSTVRNRPSWLTVDGVNASVVGAHCHWREWQVNLDLSYRVDILTPYVGVKYSNAQMQIGPFTTVIASDGSGNNHFESRVPVGLYLGCTFSTGTYFMLNVEGRLIDEEAVSISGDFRF